MIEENHWDFPMQSISIEPYLKNPVPTDNPNLPSYEIDFYKENCSLWEYLCDVYTGSSSWLIGSRIKNLKKAKEFLLQEENEPYEVYEGRVRRSRFDRVFRRAIEQDFSGILTLFKTDDLLPSLEANLDNIDLKGNDLTSFLKKADQKALMKGCCYILVEAPVYDPSIETEYDLMVSNRHPYLVLFDRSQVINWGYVNEDGKPILDFVVIKECVKESVGLYGSEDKEYYKVLRRGKYEVWEVKEDKNAQSQEARFSAELINEGITSLSEIPIVCYSLHDADMECEPPLTDLADMNVEYFRLHSSLAEILRRCNLPTLCVNDLIPSPIPQGIHAQDPLQVKEKIILGPTSLLRNVNAQFIEPSGSAIAQSITYEQQLIEAMNQQTLSFLEGNAVPKTATEAMLDSAQIFANVQNLASNKESCVQTVFTFWAKYEGLDDGGSIQVDRSLLKPPLTWTVSDVLSAISQGIISRSLGLSILNQQGLISEEQLEDEQEMDMNMGQPLPSESESNRNAEIETENEGEDDPEEEMMSDMEEMDMEGGEGGEMG